MTPVDRPDNGQDELVWVQMPADDVAFIAGFDPDRDRTASRADMVRVVEHLQAALASGRAGAGEQQRVTREEIAATLQEHIWVRVGDLFRCKCGFVPEDSPSIEEHRADELLTLLDRTQPDDDPGPQCPSTSHDTDGGWRCEHRAGHDPKVKHKNREKEW